MKRVLTILIMLSCGVISAQTYHIGDLYTAPDGSRGIVYYLHPDGSGGWVVALNDASTGCTWGASNDVPGLANQNPSYYQQLLNDTAGYANTQTLRNYQNNSTTYAAGKVDFVHGWVLPSPAQLSLLYGQLPFIATAITGAGGTALGGWYWCSAERDASTAWRIAFGGLDNSSGRFDYVTKSSSCRVRAVRSFTNISITYDTALTYQWNTGSTQPYINVNPAQTTTYQVTATTDYGCSNTAEQTVLVGSGSAQTIYDTICKGAGYEANGFSLTAEETQTAGTLTRTRTMTTSGCSSNLTLQLKVNEPAASTFLATAHGSYTWNGVTYYESGDYTQHFNSVEGCDSVVTLRLTITEPLQVTITATDDTICEGDEVSLQAIVSGEIPVYYVPTVAIGDILCTDGSIEKPSSWPVAGKTAQGIVFYVDNTGEHGWAVHLYDQETSVQWTPYDQITDIPTLFSYTNARDAITDLNGYSNTQIVRNLGNASNFPAAYAVDFDNGWFLPAVGQLRLIFGEIVTLNASLQVVGGTQFPMVSTWWYWSSTELSEYSVWNVSYRGYVTYANKYATCRVRSIRAF